MNRTFLASAMVTLIAAGAAAQGFLSVEHYKLRFAVDLPGHALSADADLTIRNAAGVPVPAIPLLLYRLMDVTSATDREGKPLPFSQKVVKLAEEPAWQVSAIEVRLPSPLAPGDAITIHLKYGGPLLGYREVMQYVRDTIGDEYSLLREETMPYPLVAMPTTADRRRAVLKSRFDYEVETTVPAGYVVACSGNEVVEPRTEGTKSIYRCMGPADSSQIDIAIAKFRVFTNPDRSLRVYALPGDADAGDRLLGEMRVALDLYRSWFGEMHGGPFARRGGLTMIEIPAGWGSYAVRGHIFQEAAAFKDPARAPEVYHEIAHIWNATPSDRVQRARWFDEAFASYFEALAIRQIQGADAFQREMERDRKSFTEASARDPRGRTTPIAEYGKDELGGFSYTKGAWSLYVLNQLLGDEMFRRSMSDFLTAFAERPADFDDFLRSVEKSSGRDLHRWFAQWITGTESSTMLIEGKTIEQMAEASR